MPSLQCYNKYKLLRHTNLLRSFINLCDIKLIRNKLYGIGNDNLQVFLTEKSADSSGSRPAGTSPSATASYTSASPAASSSAADSDKTNELLQLKKLLDMGAISQEEFDAEKARILRN